MLEKTTVSPQRHKATKNAQIRLPSLNYTATIINRRGAEFAETRNFPYNQYLKGTAYLLLSNSHLRSFALRALCDSVVGFRQPLVIITDQKDAQS